MFAYEPPSSPPCNAWEDHNKPVFIMNTIHNICESISRKGEKSPFTDVIDLLYEHIENNIEKFLPEQSYEF